jgi:hypothetical protein
MVTLSVHFPLGFELIPLARIAGGILRHCCGVAAHEQQESLEPEPSCSPAATATEPFSRARTGLNSPPVAVESTGANMLLLLGDFS